MKLTDQIEFKSFGIISEKFKEIEHKYKWIDYILSPVIVAIILLTVYFIKGVYPFGMNTIAYYDMPAQYVPFYAGAWDILHGKGGLFLNWYFGLGVPGAAGLGQFVYFPTNLFLYFTSRDSILYALSFLLLINMVLSAFTMSFYCHNKYGITTWTLCSGVLYACSGYVIQYYTNLFFLDYVILFPLIIWSVEKLITEHKYLLFILFLFLAFIPNFQFGAMIVIYLIIKVYVLLENVSDENKGRSVRLFALGGIIAALLAAFALIPSILVTLNSSRMNINNDFNYFNTLKNVYCYFRKEKQFMMYGGEVAVGLLILIILKGKKNVISYWKNIVMILVTGLPILIEGINILWHFGSYKHFPLRFGYMLTFELLIFVGEFLKNEDVNVLPLIGRIAKIIGISTIPFAAYVLWVFFKQFTNSAISDISSYESYNIYFGTLSAIFFVIFLINDKKTRALLLIILSLIQAFFGCYGFIAPKLGFADGPRVRYLKNALESHAEFKEENLKSTDRVKSEALDFESDYGAIIEQPSIGSWAYGISAETESLLLNKMGYHGTQTMIIDDGGTVFTDALLGVTRILSKNVNDEILYKKIEERTNIYKSVYSIPFGIVLNDNIQDIEEDSFEFHNELFRDITGLSDELIEINKAEEYIKKKTEMTDEQSKKLSDSYIDNLPLDVPMDTLSKKEFSDDIENLSESASFLSNTKDYLDTQNNLNNLEYILSIPVEKKKSLYLDVSDKFSGEMYIILNGKYMFFSSVMTENANYYPNDLYNGIIPLGSYIDKSAELRIYTTNDNLDGVKIGLLDLDVLSAGIEAVEKNQDLEVDCVKNGMNVTGKVYKDGTLFFPVGYSKDWHVKVNGKRAEVKPYINNAFIAVDVTKGDVDIRFTYWPQGLTIGIILSLLGFVALFILNTAVKHGGLAGKKYERLIDTISVYGFKAVAIALLVFMYVIPIYVKLAL